MSSKIAVILMIYIFVLFLFIIKNISVSEINIRTEIYQLKEELKSEKKSTTSFPHEEPNLDPVFTVEENKTTPLL